MIDVPDHWLDKTSTVEGTILLKQLICAVFTVFFQSGLFSALSAEHQDDSIQLQQDINALIDSLFIDRIHQKAEAPTPAAE